MPTDDKIETNENIFKYIPELNAFFDPATNKYRDMHGYPFIPPSISKSSDKKVVFSEDSLVSTKITGGLLVACGAVVGYFYYLQSQIDFNTAEVKITKIDIANKYETTTRRLDQLEKQSDKINDNLEIQSDLMRNLQNTMNNLLRDKRSGGN